MKGRAEIYLFAFLLIILNGSISNGADLRKSIELAQIYLTRAFNHNQVNRRDFLENMNQLMIVFSNRSQFLLLAQEKNGFEKQCRIVISEEREDPRSLKGSIVRKIEHITLGFIDEDGISKICPSALELTDEELAQALLHEAVHIAFKTQDECKATLWEMSIIKLGGGEPYANKYIQRCNLQKLAPFKSLAKETLENLFKTGQVIINRRIDRTIGDIKPIKSI